MQTLPWIVALIAFALLALVVFLWAFLRNKPGKPLALPTEWALTARPVFSTDERRVYRLLREALPHHIVLSKLPLVRFCQPTDPNEVRYWFDLLGTGLDQRNKLSLISGKALGDKSCSELDGETC